jgi:DNA-binding beta-propeller fold protein YncE
MARCCLLAVLAGAVGAAQTDNRGIHAVPAPGKVTVDGRLDDWDLSGRTLMCYDLENLREIYSAQVAAMYDADSLYVALHWKDPVPLGNSHDPRYQANKGWAGDCVQLRLKTDRISHVTAWYYGPRREPAIHLDYGKSLTQPFDGGSLLLTRTTGWELTEGAAMGCAADADGRGYVQELRLPWKLITAGRRYGAGDRFACGFELLWGEADWPVHRYADNLADDATSREFFWTAHNAWGAIILEPRGKLTLPAPAWAKVAAPEAPRGPIPVSYELPKDGLVTIAIDDAQGRRVRNLLAYLPRKEGAHTERWDGLDDHGKLVPAGAYTWRALRHDPLRVKYVMTFANPGDPGWETSDGRGAFYSDHANPQAVATAGDCVALGCPMGEAGKHLIGCDLTGQRRWGLANRTTFDGAKIALATDGKLLYVATEGKTLFVYRVEAATGRYAPWARTAQDAAGQTFKVLDLPLGEPAPERNLGGLALRGGVLAAALKVDGQIKLLDAETGDVRATVPVPAPRAVAYAPDGDLLVLSGARLLRGNERGEWRALPFDATDAHSLAVDADGRIYVSVRGAAQQVAVLSAEGAPQRTIGAAGGRPAYGPYNAGAMRNPAGVAVDKLGRIWVVEENDNPKRTSVWSADGRLVKDLPGTLHYASAGILNPFDATMGFADETVYKLDLPSGGWRPVYSFGRRGDPADLFPPEASLRGKVVRRGGRTYLYTTDTARGASEAHCTLHDPSGRGPAWRSVAHIGLVQRGQEGQFAKFLNPLFDGHDKQFFAWVDQNGDGLVQANELSFWTPTLDGKPTPFTFYYWGQLPDDAGTFAYVFSGRQALGLFGVQGYNACGAPVYSAEATVLKPAGGVPGESGSGMVCGGGAGVWYLNQDPLCAIERSGKVLFTYPSRHVSVHGSHTAKASAPGYLIGPSSILGAADVGGEAGEVFDLNGNLGENYLFTRDGLFIQALFRDTRGYFETPREARRDMSMDLTTAGGESFGGNFIKSADGKVYLTIGGTEAKVLEITGLDTIRRFGGQVTVTPQQVEAARVLAQELAAAAKEPKTARLAKAAAPLKIGGRPSAFAELGDDNKPALEIRESPHRRYGRVAARWDADKLYVAWRVFSAPKLRNAGQDEKLLFKTGDCVDVVLASAAGKSPVRLLVSSLGGQLTAVLYEATVPGTAARDRVPFSSPWRTIWFDRVSRPAGVELAQGSLGGLLVEAAIPWTALGVKPVSGLKLKADFGVLVADSGGTQTIARHYWSNKATGLVNDIPGEADLTPNLWGDVVLE